MLAPEKSDLNQVEMADTTIEQFETIVDDLEKEQTLSTTYVPDANPNSHHKSALERRLVLKADLIILPFAAMIFFVAYLDRNGIGNARIMGLQKDLKMTNYQYYNCLTLFIVGYVIFLLPANILLRYFHPHQLVGTAVICFGVLVAGLSAAQNYETVLALRIVTGAGQAFIQGLGIYIGLWYKRDELATRAGIYYSAAVISGAFGGLISYGVQKDLTFQATGRMSWRWLFIIDGAITLGVGVGTWILLPKFPDKIKNGKHWLFSADEINLALARSASYNTPGAKLDSKQLWVAVKDLKTWAFVCIASGATLGLSSVGLFLPTFITNFGYSPLRTQLLSIIPSASATVTLLVVCSLSDIFNYKGIVILFCQTLACIGYIILLTVESDAVKLVGASFVASGVYPTIVLLVAWLSINTGGFTKRGTTWGLCEVIGNLIGIIGTHVYDDAPRFIKGHSIVLGFVVLGIFNTIIAMLWMNHLNRKRDKEAAEYVQRGEAHPRAHLSLEEEYDFHPSFRYII